MQEDRKRYMPDRSDEARLKRIAQAGRFRRTGLCLDGRPLSWTSTGCA